MPEQTRRSSRLDPRAPLVLDTRELGRRPGSMLRWSRVVPAPAGLGLDVIGVPEGGEVHLDLRLESLVDGVLVSATARAPMTGECVRCLDSIEAQLEEGFQELFVYADREADEDTYRLDGDLLDLAPALRDAVVLSLPLQPVCRDGCPGLCPRCGARLADNPDHAHENTDPRWAPLRDLLPPQTQDATRAPHRDADTTGE